MGVQYADPVLLVRIVINTEKMMEEIEIMLILIYKIYNDRFCPLSTFICKGLAYTFGTNI